MRWLVALLAVSFLIPVSAEAVVLVRRPYLQMMTDSATTLVWRTDVPTTGEVQYGTDPSDLSSSVQSPVEDPNHAVRITGLEPDTTYYYAVFSAGQLLASPAETDARQIPLHRFTTHPEVGSSRAFRAWVLGDSGTGSLRQLQVADAMLNRVGVDRPDLFIHLGDMAYGDGSDDEFTTRFFGPYADILTNTPIWPTLGNHEGHSSNSAEQTGPYFEGYHLPTGGESGGLPSGTEAYYSFDYANVHFLVLDSYESDRSVEGPMLTWAAEDLAATDQEWIVAYFHHPPYTKGSHDSDREREHIEMRENALPILEAAGVDLVMGGHSHVYERSYLLDGAYETPSTSFGIIDSGDGRILGDGPYQKDPGATNAGALYVTAGHGGTGVRSSSDHPLMYITEPINGSVLLDFEQGRLTITNVRYTGVVSDTAVLVKGRSVVVGVPDGGEKRRPGALSPIRWASTGDVGDVKIEYTCDDGNAWETVVEQTDDDGRFDWVIPEVESRAVRVRVSPVEEPDLGDQSNATFYVGRVGPYEDLPWGSEWRYWDKPRSPGERWAQRFYDDSDWQRGRGEFGYGDGDETVVLAFRPVHASYYFRRRFSVADEVTAVWLSARFDDAVAIFVDGTLAVQVNMSDGFAHSVGASSPSSDNELIQLPLPPELFTPGDHVLGAIVKQRAGSVDLSFDASVEFTFSRSAALPCNVEPGAAPGGLPPEGCEGCEASMAGTGATLLVLLPLVAARRRRERAAF
jgi:hypothetical protein